MIDKPIFLVDADWWARFGATVQGKVDPDEKGDYEEERYESVCAQLNNL